MRHPDPFFLATSVSSKGQVSRCTPVGRERQHMQRQEEDRVDTQIQTAKRARPPTLYLSTFYLISSDWRTDLHSPRCGLSHQLSKWTGPHPTYLPDCSCTGAIAFWLWIVTQTRETGVCFMVLHRHFPEMRICYSEHYPPGSFCFYPISFCRNLKFQQCKQSLLYMVCILPTASHLRYNSTATSTLLLSFEW